MNSFNTTTAFEKLAKHHDVLDTVKRVLDLVDDPAPLHAAHAAAREEMMLTLEQSEKYQEALELIQQHPAIVESMEHNRKEFAADQETHQGDVEAFSKWRKEETERLEKIDEELKIFERTLNTLKKDMAEEWKKKMEEYSALVTPIDDARGQNEKDKKANEKEAARLEKLSAKLERKAQRLAKAAGDDDQDEEEAE